MTDLSDELRTDQPIGPTAVTFGVFDGVHLGHQHLIRVLREAASHRELTPVVVTLSNHPLAVLRPELNVVLLTELGERLRRLRADLLVAEEQLAHFAADANDARVRSLVSETAISERAHRGADRHARAMARHRDEVVAEIARLEATQDELLDRLTADD